MNWWAVVIWAVACLATWAALAIALWGWPWAKNRPAEAGRPREPVSGRFACGSVHAADSPPWLVEMEAAVKFLELVDAFADCEPLHRAELMEMHQRIAGNRPGGATWTEADRRLFLEAVTERAAERLGMDVGWGVER